MIGVLKVESTKKHVVKIFIKLAFSLYIVYEGDTLRLNRTKCLLRRDREKTIYQRLRGQCQFVGVAGVPLLRAGHPQVTQTRIIHGHSRLYRGRYRSLSIRFRAISYGTSRKRWRVSFRCVETFGFMTLFFSTTRILQSRDATKENQRKNVAETEGREKGQDRVQPP